MSAYLGMIFSLLLLLPVAILSEAVHTSNTDFQVHLSPDSASVTEGNMAVFSCSMNCTLHHSFLWLVGPSEQNIRLFTSTSTSRFQQRTGIHVELKDQSTCNDNKGEKRQRLTIHTSSLNPNLIIRCVAQPTTPEHMDVKSNYSSLTVHPVTTESTTSLPPTSAAANTDNGHKSSDPPATEWKPNKGTIATVVAGKLPQRSGSSPSFSISSRLLLSLLFLVISFFTNHWMTSCHHHL